MIATNRFGNELVLGITSIVGEVSAAAPPAIAQVTRLFDAAPRRSDVCFAWA